MRFLRLIAIAILIGTASSAVSARKLKKAKHEIEFVDLGLGVLWADCNLGATGPSDYGNFYAWAEVETKDFFSWGNYRYCSSPKPKVMDKYILPDRYSMQEIKADNLTKLKPEDDVASVLSGGKWRMPTADDFFELISNCRCDTAMVDGRKGLRFISQVPGFEGRSIFIPFGGCVNGNEPLKIGKELYVWSATTGQGNSSSYLTTDNGSGGLFLIGGTLREGSSVAPSVCSFESRFEGMNVRPVRPLDDDMFTSLSFTVEQLDLIYGENRKEGIVMMPSRRPVKENNITWSSSDPNVADVVDGNLTATGKGNCIITAESEGKKAELAVSVSLPAPEPVDLGLSVMWASANLGATRPEESGGYFAWGETSPKAGLYTGERYKFGQYVDEMTKYNFYTSNWVESDYPLDYKESLDPEDDAAMVLLGDGWRMPTADELWELRTKCTWEAKFVQDTVEFRINGTVEHFFQEHLLGYVITSNVPGYEGRSIYLPAAGYIGENMVGFNSSLVNEGGAYYWTSTLNQFLGNNDKRWYGNTIRPVMDFPETENRNKVQPDAVKPLKHKAQVDLGLSVLWADCNVGADRPEEYGARFAWGETSQKTYYSGTNYKYMRAYKDVNKWWYSKYIPFRDNSNDPFKDGKNKLDPDDDAARVNWGGKWRTPTKEEFAELFSMCEWTEDSVNGVKGYRLTSKVPGYTQNHIFLPYTSGNRDLISVGNSDYDEGRYMTSDLSSGYTDRCVLLEISAFEFGTSDEIDLGLDHMAKVHIWANGRSSAFFVRAVCDK